MLAGREGKQSWVARTLSTSDVQLHEVTGWILAALAALALVTSLRATVAFARHSTFFERTDLRWARRWPSAAWTGDFAPHRGHFDPGQRVGNALMVVSLAALVVSGAGLALASGGTLFVWMLRIHKLATFVLTPVVIGHIIVASGVLPGYRGVWRAMHSQEGIDRDVAARLWPEWERARQGSGDP